MLRSFTTLLVPVMVLALYPATADAQWWPAQRSRVLDPIAGSYVNVANGGSCYVQPQGWSYLFTNEYGSQATFEWSGPRQLINVGGEWDFNGVATVLRGPLGRTEIRFDAPNTAPG